MDRRDFIARGLVVAPALAFSPVPDTAVLGRPRRTPSVGGSDDRFEAVARVLEERMEALGVPGAALGVVKDGVALTRAFGLADAEEPRPVTTDTVFPLASISKTVAATAVASLAEQGRLELDAPVRRYLPDFRVRDETASAEVTLRHLFTHTPGWEGQLGLEDRGLASLAHFASEGMQDLPQLARPGEVWSYNNAGFALAGRVIEVVTGRDIHAALRELVFAPLGLTRALTRVGDVVTYSFAQGHRPVPGGGVEIVRPFLLGSSVTAGGVAMSVTDLIRYARFHLGDEEVGGAAVLSTAARAAMRAPLVRKEPTGDEMAFSWHLRRVGGVLTASHGGTAGAGCRLLLELVPERSLAFAILTNHTEAWRLVETVERAALDVYEGVSLAPGQAICHRGINEDMTSHAAPLSAQPDPRPYVGVYARPPLGTVEVREEDGGLVLSGSGGAGPASARLAFHGPDLAYAVGGAAYAGMPFEFVRRADGGVGWMRLNGRVARREG